MSVIKFGPGGLGPVKDAVKNLEMFQELGLRACEVEFTYGVYIKKDEDALMIGKKARELGIVLSIHAPYFVNLNSEDSEKVEASKKRILDCCRVGSLMGVKRVVFHPAFYAGRKSEEVVEKVSLEIAEIMDVCRENDWDVEVCPEVMGKKNVFGGLNEIAGLVEKTGCGFCIDVAHVLARYGEYEFKKIEKAFPQREWHVHFSGMEFGDKGERKHLDTSLEDWERVLKWLAKLDKDVVLICEAPDPVGDAKVGLQLWRELNSIG